MALSDRSTKFSLVIEQEIKGVETPLSVSSLETFLSAISLDYYFILHDKDTTEFGELKRPHFHVVLITPHRTRVSTIISRFAKGLNIPEVVVSCEVIDNFNYILSYLLHYDSPTKFQYPPFDVYSNNRERFDLAFVSKTDEIDFNTIYTLISEPNCTRADLMRTIGLNQYNKYWRAINDLFYERNSIRK